MTAKKPSPAVAPTPEGMPQVFADRFQIVDDGWYLQFESHTRGTLRLPLDVDMDTLVSVVSLDALAFSDPKDLLQVAELLTKLAGEDAGRIGSRELMPVFERWSWELARAMGGVTLGE